MIIQEVDVNQTALRLKSARSLVQMTRKDFCEKYGLNLHTVQSWEVGRFQMRTKGAQAFCDALAQEGVFCSPEWLVEGIGESPRVVNAEKNLLGASNGEFSTEGEVDEQTLIESEIAAFEAGHRKANIKAVVVRVSDNAMMPEYERGDYVGGRVREGACLEALKGKACIIEIGPENYVVRKFCRDGTRIVLLPEDLGERILSFDNVVTAAEIVWHRRAPRR